MTRVLSGSEQGYKRREGSAADDDGQGGEKVGVGEEHGWPHAASRAARAFLAVRASNQARLKAPAKRDFQGRSGWERR